MGRYGWVDQECIVSTTRKDVIWVFTDFVIHSFNKHEDLLRIPTVKSHKMKTLTWKDILDMIKASL